MSDCRFGVSPVNYPDPDPENVEIPNETLQRYIVMTNRKCSYPIHQKSGRDLPNALKAMGVCLFQGHTYWRMNKNALA